MHRQVVIQVNKMHDPKAFFRLLLILTFSIIPLVQFFIGVTISNQCPALQFILLYMIGGGIGEIVFLISIFYLFSKIYLEDEEYKCHAMFICIRQRHHLRSTQAWCWWIFIIFGVFSGICFIVGHSVYLQQNSLQSTNSTLDNYCAQYAFNANFGLIIGSYISFALLVATGFYLYHRKKNRIETA